MTKALPALPLLILLLAAPAAAAEVTPGECAVEAAGAFRCLYRSGFPSAGLIAICRHEGDCRVGYYYGDPDDAVWLGLPPGMGALPRPEVIWLTATLAQVRLACGPRCAWSYFFEARRRRLSAPRPSVLAVDWRRLLYAAPEGRQLVVRQVFSGRAVARIERDWAPGGWLGDVIPLVRFDADGRLALRWLQGRDRAPVSERIAVPSLPR